MTNLDRIVEFLHYHPGASRNEIMAALQLAVKDTQAIVRIYGAGGSFCIAFPRCATLLQSVHRFRETWFSVSPSGCLETQNIQARPPAKSRCFFRHLTICSYIIFALMNIFAFLVDKKWENMV